MANNDVVITQTPTVGNWKDVEQVITLKNTSFDHKITNRLKLNEPKPQNDVDADPEMTMLGLKLVIEVLHVEGYLMDDTDTSITTTINEGGTLTAADETITLTSVTGFAAYGAVIIGKEIIQYTSISGNNLTDCTRGYAGSTATTHADGSTVYQCNAAVHQKQKIVDFIKTGNNFTSLTWGDETFDTDYGGVYLEDAIFEDADRDKDGNPHPEQVKFQYALTILIGLIKNMS
jgi:hypothetical protein